MKGKKIRVKYLVRLMIFLEFFLFFILFFLLVSIGTAQVGNNVTTKTNLTIGNSAPDILNITIYQDVGGGIDLVANSTKTVTVEAIIKDFNGETDILNASVTFYSTSSSFYADSDDNNRHYFNSSCTLNNAYGDSMESNVTCKFNIWYYADNSTWNVSVLASDQSSLTDFDTSQVNVNTLLSVGLPDLINYGFVNATNVSSQVQMNISNYGNVKINLTLEGYAVNRSDGLAMNCSLGATRNISIGYEKYNLTFSNTSIMNLTDFQLRYQNLTNSSVIRAYGLNQRFNDTTDEAFNSSYWRIYVPLGVAGGCTGNIIVGATRANGT